MCHDAVYGVYLIQHSELSCPYGNIGAEYYDYSETSEQQNRLAMDD